MKKIFISIAAIILISFTMQAESLSDTSINGVNVQFSYSTNIFPESWLTPEINARGEEIDPAEIKRTKNIMVIALSKYPVELLSVSLRSVYFLKNMSMYDVGFGGTNSSDAVYLTNNGVDLGYTNAYIEQTFHHEFSSILFRNYPALIDTVAWKAANIPSFDYNDPEAGVGAIRKNESSQDLDTALCRVGFLTQYAYSGIENDINTIAQNLFKPNNGFWNIVNNYPRIREKVRLLIEFYSKLSSNFSSAFFMKMN